MNLILNSLSFFIFFYFFLFSFLGYGFFVKAFFFKNKFNDNIDGFLGLFFVTLVSYFSSLFFAHGYFHNLVLHLIGFFFFCYFLVKLKNKNIFMQIIYISLFCILLVLISKTHDDFSYYHLPFTKFLVENKVVFGLGHLGHGYNLISSIFFLNSTLYIPGINLYSFHFPNAYFLIFFNFFLIDKILNDKRNLIIFISILSFLFFNISFNRIAEFGTDKPGQLLAIVIFIQCLSFILKYQKEKNDIDFFVFYFLSLMVMTIYLITMKTYFITYTLLPLSLILILNNKKEFIYKFIKKPIFLLILVTSFLLLLHNIIFTGCFVSPVSKTCLGNTLFWAREKSEISHLQSWLELWSKAGAAPGISLPENERATYVENFNWVKIWYQKYFKIKALDQILIYILSILMMCFFFKKEKKTAQNKSKNIYFLFFPIIFIFFIWFMKHPALRYGGYSASFIFFSYLLIAALNTTLCTKKNYKKFFLIIGFVIISLVNIKNVIRIKNEFNRNDYYKFNFFPVYSLKQVKQMSKKYDNGFIIYYTDDGGHCWGTKTPCTRGNPKTLKVLKKNNYFFIHR
jgi:hypothetical protein